MSSVAVIGAGHNGLVCAALLARAGREVTVLEAGQEPGGCIWTEQLPSGHRLERGAIELGGIVGIAEELHLADHGLRWTTRPVIAGAAFADRRLTFAVSAEETVAQFGADGPAYLAFAELAARLFALIEAFPRPPTLPDLAAGLGPLPGGEDLLRLLVSSCEVVLHQRFDDPHLASALAMHGAHGQTPPWAPGTGLFALLLPSGHGVRPARPIGGSRALVTALVRAVEAAGGTVRTGAQVTRLEPRDGGAVAHIGDGDAVAADVVVSSIDVRRTTSLLDAAPAPLRAAARGVGSGRLNVGELKVDAALEVPLDLGPLDHAPDALWMLQDDPGVLRRAFGDIVAGRLPDPLPVMLTIPSAADPGAAPPGGSVVWVSAFVPLRPRHGWTRALEQEAAARACATVRRLTGADLTRAVDMRVTGPLAWAERIGSSDGNPNHLDLSLDQLLGWRPNGTAPVDPALPWLYLTGAGTHPGGGVTGAPGRATATAVLNGSGGAGGPRSEMASLIAGWRFYRRMRRGV